jgi:NitT/TauT family transport system substrate-binding protein
MISFQRVIRVFVLLFSLVSVSALADKVPQLRISLPPRLGALPLALAEQWGLYEEEGVTVKVAGLPDDQARSLALMTGAIDGMVCDVVTAILFVTSGTDIVITGTAYCPQSGSLSLLSRSYYNITSIGDLLSRTQVGNMQKSIGIIERSDFEYHLDTLLTSLGYAVNPDRDYWGMYDTLQLATFLSLGSVYAAVLPEPYTSYIEYYPLPGSSSPLIHLSDFEGIELLPEIVVFRREVLRESPEVVESFYRALRKTIERINTSSREELIEAGVTEALSLFFPGTSRESIPLVVLDSLTIPYFQQPRMLSREQFEDVVAWLNAKRYTWQHPSYEKMTTDRFIQNDRSE